MSSKLLQASSGLPIPAWHGIDWAGCYRRVRSLQRRIVQAMQAGAGRKVKRLSYLLVHSFAARALAVKRVMHQNIPLHRRVLHGALVMLERSAVKVARCVLRGERSREAPDLPGDVSLVN
jgi:N-terminal domain of reverse transcriptase